MPRPKPPVLPAPRSPCRYGTTSPATAPGAPPGTSASRPATRWSRCSPTTPMSAAADIGVVGEHLDHLVAGREAEVPGGAPGAVAGDVVPYRHGDRGAGRTGGLGRGMAGCHRIPPLLAGRAGGAGPAGCPAPPAR